MVVGVEVFDVLVAGILVEEVVLLTGLVDCVVVLGMVWLGQSPLTRRIFLGPESLTEYKSSALSRY